MSRAFVLLDSDGIQTLLKSKEVSNLLEGYAKSIKNELGEGHDIDTKVGKTRVYYRVKTTTRKAFFKALNEDTLLKVGLKKR